MKKEKRMLRWDELQKFAENIAEDVKNEEMEDYCPIVFEKVIEILKTRKVVQVRRAGSTLLLDAEPIKQEVVEFFQKPTIEEIRAGFIYINLF